MSPDYHDSLAPQQSNNAWGGPRAVRGGLILILVLFVVFLGEGRLLAGGLLSTGGVVQPTDPDEATLEPIAECI